jgi:hypothetical protein
MRRFCVQILTNVRTPRLLKGTLNKASAQHAWISGGVGRRSVHKDMKVDDSLRSSLLRAAAEVRSLLSKRFFFLVSSLLAPEWRMTPPTCLISMSLFCQVNNPEPFGDQWSAEGVYPAEEALSNFVEANKARTVEAERDTTDQDVGKAKVASKKPKSSETTRGNAEVDEKITKHASSSTDTRKDTPKPDATAADNYDQKAPEKGQKIGTEERGSGGRRGQASSSLQRPSLLHKDTASSWSDNVEFEDVDFPPPPSWNDNNKWQQSGERGNAHQNRSRSAAAPPDFGGQQNPVTAGSMHTSSPPRGGQDRNQRTTTGGAATPYVPRSQGAAPEDSYQASRTPRTDRGDMAQSHGGGQRSASQNRYSGMDADSNMDRDASGSSYGRNSGVPRSDAGAGGMRRMPWASKGADTYRPYQNKNADNSSGHSSSSSSYSSSYKSSSEHEKDSDDKSVSGSFGYKHVANTGLSPEFEMFARGLRLLDEAEQSMLLRQDEVS